MPKKKKELFRDNTLERLSSPEQLDIKLTVVPPAGWIAMSSLAVLLIAALFWGVFGTISNQVYGNGILMYEDGIAKVTSHTSGQITDICIEAGAYVEKGDIIARVSQDELEQRIEQLQESLAALDSVNADTLSLDIESLNFDLYTLFAPLAEEIRSARAQYDIQQLEAEKSERDLENQRALQLEQIQAFETQIKSLETQIQSYKELLGYEKKIELENAKSDDQKKNTPVVSEAAQVRSRPAYDATLFAMENERLVYQLNLRNLLYGMEILQAKIQQTEPGDEKIDLQRESEGLQQDIHGLRQQISMSDTQISQYREILAYQRRIDLQNAEIRDKQQTAERNAPNTYQQVQSRPDYDYTLASLQSQLISLEAQLSQAQTQYNQMETTFLDYLWKGHEEAGEQVSSLMNQFINLKQVKRQDYLRQLQELQEEHEKNTVITAEFDGIVSDLKIQIYDYIQPGSDLGTMLRGNHEIDTSKVMLYVGLDKGKVIQEGMEAHISPSTVNREEHGYILGEVISVSVYAVTQEHMMVALQNQQLVQDFGGESAVLEVKVELQKDEETTSGHQWSTPKGAPFEINPGTICKGEVKVSGQRPIDMIVPFIKGLFK